MVVTALHIPTAANDKKELLLAAHHKKVASQNQLIKSLSTYNDEIEAPNFLPAV